MTTQTTRKRKPHVRPTPATKKPRTSSAEREYPGLAVLTKRYKALSDYDRGLLDFLSQRLLLAARREARAEKKGRGQ